MPDLCHKIKDVQYHTWHVTDWKNLEKRLTGPEFTAGGRNWRLLLFPFGNYNYNNKDHVGIYLDFVDPYDDLHITVQFALLLWNQKEPTKFVSHETYHLFTVGESDWGFTGFYDLNKLFVPADGRTHPLIENDACNVTVLVRVLEDPTKYIGLKGRGCCLNSVIQLLYYIRYLQKALYQIPMESDKSAKCITSALQRIFYQLNVSHTEVETMELKKFFGWNTFNMGNIRNFINILQDDLENKMKNTKVDGTINKLFAGMIKTHIKCDNVDYEYQRVDEYYEGETLDDSFMNFIQEETLDGNNKYDTDYYGLQAAKKRATFESFPPVLRIYLDYDSDPDGNYEYPTEIDLQKYLSSPNVDKSKSCRYLLYGLKFNDDQITLESYGEIFQESHVVHMLVYICESDANEILSPILPKDIPDCLHEEKESDLHMQTWIVTEETFKGHKGLGLIDFNNEQYPFSHAFQFNILKESTYGDFKKTVSAKFEIPINRMKFWVILNRSNKINRLHEPVTDDFLDKSMKDVKTELVKQDGELVLYMEVLENDVPLHSNMIIVFLKYFNPEAQLLEGLGHLRVQIHSRIDSIFPIICAKTNLPPKSLFDIYEEFASDMSKKMIPKFTFKMAGIQNGDIICLQKTLKNREIQKLDYAGRIHNIPQFYESLSMNIIVQFKSNVGYKDPIPEFTLVLNKEMTYKSIARHVAIYLNTDPLRLRFTTSGYLKKEIKETTSQTLLEILRSST
ncbi:15500_t:CDS:10, partial [Cetraspora pellucida]